MQQAERMTQTTFDKRTPQGVRDELERARLSHPRQRVRIFLGNPDGTEWAEEYGVTGFVGRSTGTVKIPLLLHTRLSHGGPGILDRCIVRLLVDGREVYRHPTYKPVKWTIDTGRAHVLSDGTLHAKCRNLTAAYRLVAFLRGERATP